MYFARDACKSDRYIHDVMPSGPHKGKRAMLVCAVLLGCTLVVKGHLPAENTEVLWDVEKARDIRDGFGITWVDGRPADASGGYYDSYTVVGLKERALHRRSVVNNEYVVFAHGSVLPKYVIYYKKE